MLIFNNTCRFFKYPISPSTTPAALNFQSVNADVITIEVAVSVEQCTDGDFETTAGLEAKTEIEEIE